jgi:hypothetical protein
MKTRQQFLKAEDQERNLFISKLMHIMQSNDHFFSEVAYLVRVAEITGMFNNVKFGAEEVYKQQTT